MPKTPSVLFIIDTKNLCCHVSIVFIIPSSLSWRSQKEISFLDIWIIHSGQKMETRLYRKSTNTDIYIHWNSYAPSTWKCSTLKSLIMRAYTISSNDSYLKLELKHLWKVFHEQNGCPHRLITKSYEWSEKVKWKWSYQ